MYQLSDIDIRLLRVFRAVVECRGFANARALLNIGESTISNHIGNLEDRLGFRLCYRGRTGFRLTQKGERVYEELLLLFRAHETFQNVTLELKGKLSGFLKIAVVDSVITDPVCPVIRGIELLNRKASEVTISLAIMAPNRLEQALLENRIDVAIGPFERELRDLAYQPIYSEPNTLYCAPGHPIAQLDDKAAIIDAVQRSRKVTRSYLEGRDIVSLGQELGSSHASVEFLEGAAIMMMGGGHIGFLPPHYAEVWVAEGKLVPILPERYRYVSEFHVVTRRTPRESVILSTFLAELEIAMDEAGPPANRLSAAVSG